MTDPNHEVERHGPKADGSDHGIYPYAEGRFVLYSDYEKLKEERDTALLRVEGADVMRANLLVRANKAEAERDQANAQALAEVREALEETIKRQEVHTREAGWVVCTTSLEAFIDFTLSDMQEERL